VVPRHSSDCNLS
jgi:tRNA (uracil-5-)-methyltransferase TRM9